MSSTGVFAVDDDVATLAIADNITASRDCGLQAEVTAADGVIDFHVQRSSCERRARSIESAPLVPGRSRRHLELRPATLQAHLIRALTGARLGAAKLGQQFAIGVFRLGTLAARRRIESPEVRQVDRARVGQPTDHLLRQIALDLLGLELAHESLQQLARFVPVDALDFDRAEQIAIVLGDRQVHAHVACDEVLELLAHRRDQRRISAQMLGIGQHLVPITRGAKPRDTLLARAAHDRLREHHPARRQVHPREHPIDLVQNPTLERHVSTPVGDHHRRQWSSHLQMPHTRPGGKAIALREPIDEMAPCRLDRFPRLDARLERRQRQVDLHRDFGYVTDLHDRAPKRVLHILQAGSERPVESPHQRRFHTFARNALPARPPLALVRAFHLSPPARYPAWRAAICMAISAAGFGP